VLSSSFQQLLLVITNGRQEVHARTLTSVCKSGIGPFHTVCVRALPVGHYWSQTNRRGVVAELLDTVAMHRFV